MRWLFVVGCNNTFTTLLKNILKHHPEIDDVPGEGHRASRRMPNPSTYRVGRIWAAHPLTLDAMRHPKMRWPWTFRKLKADWMKHYHGGKYMMEKSPPDSVRIPWLNERFKEDRQEPLFIALFKNPYAVCEGIVRRRGYKVAMETAARHTRNVYEIMMKDLGTFNYKFMLIPYERFVNDIGDWLRVVEDFLGIEYFEYPRLERVDTDRVQKSISMLSDEDIATINKYWSPVYERLGYEKMEEF